MSSKKEEEYHDESNMIVIELHQPNLKPAIPKVNFFTLESQSTLSSVLKEMKLLKIEVIAFLYMFSYTIRSISSTTMMMEKVCLVHLQYPKEICANLTGDYKDEVEKITNNYHLGHTLVQIAPSAFLICFLGPWSDKYGRKLPMIWALLGIIIDGLGSTFCAYYMDTRVDYYLISAIFTGLSGGFIIVLTVVYSYAADVTTFGKRTIKFALLEMAFGFAIPAGQAAGGWLFRYTGYVPVFCVSTLGHVAALFWVLFILEETRGQDNQDDCKTKFKNLWSMEAFVGSFKATVKARPHSGRKQILWLIVCMSVFVLNLASTGSISYLYAYKLYSWGNTKFSTVTALYAVCGIVAMLISVPLLKRLKAGDATLGIIGSLSCFFKNIGIALANRQGIYHVANMIGLLSTLGSLASRSRISKIVSKDDLGKVFAFVTTAETFLPIVTTSIFSQIFNATLKTFPGAVYMIMGILILIPLGVYIWLAMLPSVDYEDMHKNQQKLKEEMAITKLSELEIKVSKQLEGKKEDGTL